MNKLSYLPDELLSSNLVLENVEFDAKDIFGTFNGSSDLLINNKYNKYLPQYCRGGSFWKLREHRIWPND